MNDQKNKYKKFENQTFLFEGNKIFIQRIKELSEIIIIHTAGDTLQFSKDNIQEEFFDKISSKFDKEEIHRPIISSKSEYYVVKNNPKDTILQEAAEYLNKPSKMNTENKTTTPVMNTQNPTENTEIETLNNLDTQLNATGVFKGFDEVRDSLLSALKKIQNTQTSEQLSNALQESKAVYEISNAVNDMAKTKVQAAGLLMKYSSK